MINYLSNMDGCFPPQYGVGVEGRIKSKFHTFFFETFHIYVSILGHGPTVSLLYRLYMEN